MLILCFGHIAVQNAERYCILCFGRIAAQNAEWGGMSVVIRLLPWRLYVRS